MLPNLTKLVMAHNKLESIADVEHAVQCPRLSVLDLQHNRINDPAVIEEVFAKIPELVRVPLCVVPCCDD